MTLGVDKLRYGRPTGGRCGIRRMSLAMIIVICSGYMSASRRISIGEPAVNSAVPRWGLKPLLGVGDKSALIYHGQFGSSTHVTGP